MPNFLIFTLRALKRLLSRKNLILLTLILVVSLYSVHKSTFEYKCRIAEVGDFKKLDALIFSKIPDYDKYSDIGVRVFFRPSATSIFFQNSSFTPVLSAEVDSIADLKIHTNAKTPQYVKRPYPIKLDFSLIILLVGSLAALYVGSSGMRKREFFMSLAGIYPPIKIYLVEILSRVIFLCFSYLFILGINVGYVLLQSVKFTAADISGLISNIAAALMMLLFFFFLGVIIRICYSLEMGHPHGYPGSLDTIHGFYHSRHLFVK